MSAENYWLVTLEHQGKKWTGAIAVHPAEWLANPHRPVRPQILLVMVITREQYFALEAQGLTVLPW